MLIRNVQVARNFFTVLLSLYNSALWLGNPNWKWASTCMLPGLLAQLPTLRKNEYLNFALLVHCTFKNIKVLPRVWNAGCIDEENLCNNLAISSLVIVSFMPWYLCLIKQGLTSLSPLSPKSDQHQFSPNNINTQLREKVMRIDEIIT